MNSYSVNFTDDRVEEHDEEKRMFTCFQCDMDECKTNKLRTCSQAIKCFSSVVESLEEGVRFKRGCLSTTAEVLFNCNKPHFRVPTSQYSFQCCSSHLCNSKEFPRLPPLAGDRHFSETPEVNLSVGYYGPVLGFVGLLALFLLIMAYIFFNFSRRLRADGNSSKGLLPYHHTKGVDTTVGLGESSIQRLTWRQGKEVKEVRLNFFLRFFHRLLLTTPQQGSGLLDSERKSFADQSVSSGSGTGVPLLSRKTLAQMIELKECIGKGRFGQVYRGLMQGDDVAVKIFYSDDEVSFKRETEVYSIVLIRHDNVLCFLGSDILSERANLELWLVTAFHPLGSLYDYLTSCADVVEQGLEPEHALDLARSLVSGITHLHTEICGTSGKPAIAHRDIKSKNIILKTPRHCLIADFGLAVIRHDRNKEVSEADIKSSRVGTRRYMAPEVLDLTMNKYKFQTYRQADIYSMALVLWEITHCARNPTTGDKALGHRLPYYNKICLEPTLEQMQKVVCVDKYRPTFPAHFAKDPILSTLATVIPQCWKDDSTARLSALRVKKTLHASAEVIGLS